MADTYTLPGGREYIPRPLPGFKDDVTGLREILDAGEHVLLLGDPGCGKTALMQAAFPDSENELGHSKMTAPDMLWKPRIDPNAEHGVTYDPAPLTRAAMRGKKLYFDEIMRASEDALTPLYSAQDGRGFIVGGNLDGTDLPVEPGFGVVAASNPMVRGAFLPDAIASRFHILMVETTIDLIKKFKFDERLTTIWTNLSQIDGGDVWRPSIRDMLRAQKFLDIVDESGKAKPNLPQAAYAITGFRIPARHRAQVADVVGPVFGVRVGEDGGVIR